MQARAAGCGTQRLKKSRYVREPRQRRGVSEDAVCHIQLPRTTAYVIDKQITYVNFASMSESIGQLAQQAIDAAMKGKWTEAVKINQDILEQTPADLSAKTRLGKAWLQLSEFTKAKKYFKEVLSVDPINPIALKNYEKAKQKRVENNNTNIKPDYFIKQPGTYIELTVNIRDKGISNVAIGDKITLKPAKNTTGVYKGITLLGDLDEHATKIIKSAKNQNAKLQTTVLVCRESSIKIAVNASIPVFRSEKQEIRPYVKKGSIDEPELELPQEEEEEELA